MKKIFFFRVSVLMISVFFILDFGTFNRVEADDSALSFQREIIVYLCDDNAKLSETLDDLIGINIISFNTKAFILPTGDFFRLIKQKVEAGELKRDYKQIIVELYKDNAVMIFILKELTFKAESAK